MNISYRYLWAAALGLTACCTAQDDNYKLSEDNKAAPEKLYDNIVFIISDDHSYKTVGCYGNEHIRTPNLDRLASRGTRFINAYSNSPISAPSRQSMMTGKYPHATGVSLVFTPFPDSSNVTIAEYLKTFDFQTAIIGKTHFNHHFWWDLYQDGFPTHGYDLTVSKKEYNEWLTNNPQPPLPEGVKLREKGSVAHKNPEYRPMPFWDAYSPGTYYAHRAVDFMAKNKDRRFCLWLAFNEPHAPFNFPIEYAGKYHPDSLPLPQGSPEDDRWIPEMFRDLTEAQRRGIIASYYTSVEYMDKNTGLVLSALDSLGLRENTLVVYCGDQGYLLNEHKRFEKHTMWAESVKAPLIVSGAKHLQTNIVSDALVEFVDIVPTVVEALGFEQHADYQGSSFLGLLKGDTTEHRRYVFSEFHHDNKAMVATKAWKYIFTTGKRDLDLNYQTGYGASGIYHRLYDLKNDPNETTNVVLKPENQQIVRELQQQMLNVFESTHPHVDECPKELNKLGRLVWFLEPQDVGSVPGPPQGVTLPDTFRQQIKNAYLMD